MTDVLEMLAAASPDVNDEPVPSIEDVWRKLEEATGRCGARRSSRASGWWRRRRALRWATVGVAAVAAAVSVLVVGTTGGGSASAFAGWTAHPTRAAAGQLHAAQLSCASNAALSSLTPTLTDTRGPFSMFVYAQPETTTICVAGPLTAGGAPGTVVGQASAPNTSAIAPGTIDAQGGILTSFRSGGGMRILTGQVGPDVTGVTLVLFNGVSVQATTQNGWFAAWWPSLEGVQSAELTTAAGSTTLPFNIGGMRPPAMRISVSSEQGGSSATGSSGPSAAGTPGTTATKRH